MSDATRGAQGPGGGRGAGTEPLPHVDVHEGDGPPLVLVHGIMAGRALWAANLDALRAVCTPIVVELYGHGRSPTPSDPQRYSPDAYVAVLERLRERLGADRWLLFGHSLGAAVTLRYALVHPERVIGHGFSNSASALAGPGWRRRMRDTADDEARRIELGGSEGLLAHRMNPVGSRHVVPAVREALRADCHLLRPEGIAATVRAVARAASLRDRVAGNRPPCLLVAGVREAAFSEPAAHAEAVMPALTTVRVDAGHSPNAEAPERFDDVLTGFIRSLR